MKKLAVMAMMAIIHPHFSGARVPMGVKNKKCDDGKSWLDVDWESDPRNYTCYHPERKFLGNSARSVLECESLPEDYYPKHFCMRDVLEYDHPIPTHGDHRPIWPMFGEYKFVPPQRWLHNVEHGAVIMLYHPCTHYTLVHKLRKLVTGCIRKHIITPNSNLSPKKPLALVAWGCRLLMSDVNAEEVIQFIQTKGRKGPEGQYPKEGQYDHALIKLATPPPGSDMADSVLCPDYTDN